MVGRGIDRKIPRSPASVKFVRLAIDLVELLALERSDLESGEYYPLPLSIEHSLDGSAQRPLPLLVWR